MCGMKEARNRNIQKKINESALLTQSSFYFMVVGFCVDKPVESIVK